MDNMQLDRLPAWVTDCHAAGIPSRGRLQMRSTDARSQLAVTAHPADGLDSELDDVEHVGGE